MAEVSNLNLAAMVENAVRNVFSTMLSMDVEKLSADGGADVEGYKITGCVGFAGEASGVVCIEMKDDFAKLITGAMLGEDPSEVQVPDEINDVIGEMCNMVGGNLKSRFCDSGLPCVLTIPSITHGSDFRIGQMSGARKERFFFSQKGNLFAVMVFIKSEK
jgi:chemotaxis protein CheX